MQYRSTFLASLALSFTFMFAPLIALAQDGPVPPKEIQETWVGKDLTGTTVAGAPVLMRLVSDGKASIKAGATSDVGTWRLSDRGYCTTWQVIRPGQERCFTVVRSGATFNIANPDGSVGGSFTSIK